MPPPTLMHQRIARNLETLLNARLQEVKPEWHADYEVGVWLKGDEKYNPEPDVTGRLGDLYKSTPLDQFANTAVA